MHLLCAGENRLLWCESFNGVKRLLPSQLSPSAEGLNPGLHSWQEKEPSPLTQIPTGHTLGAAHSLTSNSTEKKKKAGETWDYRESFTRWKPSEETRCRVNNERGGGARSVTLYRPSQALLSGVAW